MYRLTPSTGTKWPKTLLNAQLSLTAPFVFANLCKRKKSDGSLNTLLSIQMALVWVHTKLLRPVVLKEIVYTMFHVGWTSFKFRRNQLETVFV